MALRRINAFYLVDARNIYAKIPPLINIVHVHLQIDIGFDLNFLLLDEN